MTALSMIFSVYQSHEALRRQLLFFENMPFPEDVELIIADDGSDPPLETVAAELREHHYDLKYLHIIPTNSDLAWTSELGRNMAAAESTGKVLLFSDIDHIFPLDAIIAARDFTGHRLSFKRYAGVLLPDGSFTQDLPVLLQYGFDESRLAHRGLYFSVHGNTYVLPRDEFFELGGYKPDTISLGRWKPYSNDFNHRWNHWAAARGIQQEFGPDIYMFPVGRYHREGNNNPFGLFHNLTQKKEFHHKGEDRES